MLLGRILLAALAVALPAAAPAAAADGLELVERVRVDERLEELTFTTPALQAPTRVRVLLPDGYSERRRYPVLYLLHGGNGSHRDWTAVGGAREATAGHDLIVVMPDGGLGGWYTDWHAPAADGSQPRWETYHVEQLIPWIDDHYPTRARRRGRAIAGLSMGGFGAMSYAGRHPDVFAAAAAWSGAVNLNRPPLVAGHAIDLISGLDGGLPGSPFGLRETEEIRWRGHNPWDLASNLRHHALAIRTGNGQPGGRYGGGYDVIESVVHPMAHDLHQRLSELEISHVFEDYGAGAHAWPYWHRDLRLDLPGFMGAFGSRELEPRRITYRSIEPRYEVFGWRVAIDRDVVEWSELVDARRGGFTLRGSGAATVVTPRRYRSRARFRVTVGGTEQRLRAGRRGRLRIAVPLGPSNVLQEYAVPAVDGATPRRTYATDVRIERLR